jgi:hypothetical protein
MADVQIDSEDLLEVQRTIKTFKGPGVVLARATNDTLAALKTKASQLIAAKITAKSATIKSAFSVKKMIAARQLNDLLAELKCTGDPLPLINFSVNTVKTNWGPNAGVSILVLKNKKRTVVKHAFKATMRSGHIGVFWREELFDKPFRPTFRYGIFKRIYGDPLNPYRYIHELYGPAIPDIFDDKDVIDPAIKEADVRLQARLEYHMAQFIEAAR